MRWAARWSQAGRRAAVMRPMAARATAMAVMTGQVLAMPKTARAMAAHHQPRRGKRRVRRRVRGLRALRGGLWVAVTVVSGG